MCWSPWFPSSSLEKKADSKRTWRRVNDIDNYNNGGLQRATRAGCARGIDNNPSLVSQSKNVPFSFASFNSRNSAGITPVQSQELISVFKKPKNVKTPNPRLLDSPQNPDARDYGVTANSLFALRSDTRMALSYCASHLY